MILVNKNRKWNIWEVGDIKHAGLIWVGLQKYKFGSGALPGLMLDLGLLKIDLEGVFF